MAGESDERKALEELMEAPVYLGEVGEDLTKVKFEKPDFLKSWESIKKPKEQGWFEGFRERFSFGRRRAVLFFAVVYLVFGGILVYLLFFNIGMSVDASIDPASNFVNVFVRNDGSHSINFVVVGIYIDGIKQESKTISKLKPGQERPIVFSSELEGKDVVEVITSAPFHQTVVKKIRMSRLDVVKLSSAITTQEKVFLNTVFTLRLKICNQGGDLDGIKVSANYPNVMFSMEGEEESVLSLQSGNCNTLVYFFKGLEKGIGTILFNIVAHDFSDVIEKDVEVVE